MSGKTGAHADIALRRFGYIAEAARVPIHFVWVWEDRDTQEAIIIKARSRSLAPAEIEELTSAALERERSVTDVSVHGRELWIRWEIS